MTVLIIITKRLFTFQKPLDEKVHESIEHARIMFERQLDLVSRASNPLEISLVTYVLHGTLSSQADRAFGILARNARQEGNSNI